MAQNNLAIICFFNAGLCPGCYIYKPIRILLACLMLHAALNVTCRIYMYDLLQNTFSHNWLEIEY